MIDILFPLLSVFYFGIILFFYVGIKRELKRQRTRSNWQPLVTVLVPARNEAGRILPTLNSLASQTYPSTHLQILIIDDHSGDNTAEVVQQFIDQHALEHFQVLCHRTDGTIPTYKKSAIKYALQYARGEVIMTTDADCRVQPRWVESMIAQYEADTGMVAGLVTFDPSLTKTLFHKLQTLEFAGLVFAGVGAVGNHYPLICTGSNLSYRRQAFDEVGGFDGHEHIPSGDDDLLMQNIHHHTNWKVRYNLDPHSVNFTQPVDTPAEFFNQRARWASKSCCYPGIATSILLFLVYFFYVLLLISPLLVLTGLCPIKIILPGFALKFFPEFLVINSALSILHRRTLLGYFLIAEVLQIPYIVLAGFAGFFKLFKWK